MSLDTYDVRRAVHGYFGAEDDEFDEWLESHDAEVRMDAIIARDTRTPAELIQAAWDAAYPVPEGRVIPKGTRYLLRVSDHEVAAVEAGIDLREGPSARTLDPLPPVIPEGTPAVWANTKDCDVRRVLVLSDEPTGDIPRYWRDGDGDEYTDATLIDPVPIPREGDR